MSCLLHRLLGSVSSPGYQDDTRKLKEWFRASPRDSWKYLMSEIVKESLPDVTVYHNCSFARARYGARSGDLVDEVHYGEAKSLIMVPASVRVHPFVLLGQSGDGDDGSDHSEGCCESSPTSSSEDTDLNDDLTTSGNTGDDGTGEVVVLDDDVKAGSSLNGGGDAADGISEDPSSEVQNDAPITYDNDADDCDTSYPTFPSQLYDSLPPHYVHLHVLATPLHPLPLVPILCVADEHNIVALMVSAVFQRQALGLDLPVIGILYPTTGSIISVLVAWRDDTTPVPSIRLILSMDCDLPSDGVFDLERTESLCTFVEFLHLASVQVLADLDRDTRQHSMSSFNANCVWRMDDSRDELQSPWRVDIARWARHVYHSASSCIRSVRSEAESTHPMLFVKMGSWSPERELYDKDGAALIDLQHPGIAAWSLDYHVLTVGINQGGVVHDEFPTVFDGIYSLLCPQEVSAPLFPAMAIVSRLVEAMFHSNDDEAAQDAFLVWRALMSWVFEPEASHEALVRLELTITIHTLRCREYDRVVPLLPHAYMPHVALAGLTDDHGILTNDDWRHFVMANEGPRRSLPDNCRPASQELKSVWRHMENLSDTVRAVFEEEATDTDIVMQMEMLADRLTQYPLGCHLDAAISAVDFNFLVEVGTGSGREFVHEIAFFRDTTISDDGAFCLPVLLVKHQAPNLDLEVITRNALRLCCVSAAHFLAVLGIRDFPVYGLITAGRYGYVSAAWCSESNGVLYISDHNTAHYRFDLSTNEGAMRFIGFLHRLRGHAAELKTRFASVRGQLLTRLNTAEGRAALRWTLESQIGEYDLVRELR
ncbi:hypothetical protein K466DRAFT_168040 [Polyporus arcularius HHB13444]|uniref:Uncharacterized protein n=1 Tax=Polyporus arcularius HHB13444 TaxID=1314778 RepID=A0A5C3PAR8_9APHY|nr:hypothetical protein K466DRAFT_168040 [Polyporus arcularius HHB13444]